MNISTTRFFPFLLGALQGNIWIAHSPGVQKKSIIYNNRWPIVFNLPSTDIDYYPFAYSWEVKKEMRCYCITLVGIAGYEQDPKD